MTEPVYRASPDDARHGAVVVLADAAGVTPGVRTLCDVLAGDGYEAAAYPASADVSAALQAVAGPRFLLGLGAGASAALRAEGATAVSAFYPDAVPDAGPMVPTILHFGQGERLALGRAWADAEAAPVFPYRAADGFYLEDDPAHDAASAHLARLRTLALFRRAVSRGES